MNFGFIFTFLVFFGGMAAAHIAQRQHQRQGKPVPHFLHLLATAGLFVVCVACAVGFLASFELSEQALNFRVMYACVGLLAGGAAIRVGQPTLHR